MGIVTLKRQEIMRDLRDALCEHQDYAKLETALDLCVPSREPVIFQASTTSWNSRTVYKYRRPHQFLITRRRDKKIY